MDEKRLTATDGFWLALGGSLAAFAGVGAAVWLVPDNQLWFIAYCEIVLFAGLFLALAAGAGIALVCHLVVLLYRWLRGRRDRRLARHVERALAAGFARPLRLQDQPTQRIDMGEFDMGEFEAEFQGDTR